MAIEIDQQAGAIRFPGSVLFSTNSSEIAPKGKEFLNAFIPKYLDILLQERFRSEISSIIIEGHIMNAISIGRSYSLRQAANLRAFFLK